MQHLFQKELSSGFTAGARTGARVRQGKDTGCKV